MNTSSPLMIGHVQRGVAQFMVVFIVEDGLVFCVLVI